MKIIRVSVIPMSAPVPAEKRHRTEPWNKGQERRDTHPRRDRHGLTGIGAALGTLLSGWTGFCRKLRELNACR
jgi:hypothetical protein